MQGVRLGAAGAADRQERVGDNVYSDLLQDTFAYVMYISPLFVMLGGLAFADIVIMTIVRLAKRAKDAVKW